MESAIKQKPAFLPDPLAPVCKMLQACIQCGTCTASCVNSFAMDQTPRRLWRMVIMGQKDEVFRSKTFALCSSCYYCTLRCPRGLPLTEAMAALKQIAAKEKIASCKSGTLFYTSFLESVRCHGRVSEMEFMTHYFIRMKNPVAPFKYTSLGMRLLSKGKIAIPLTKKKKGPGSLKALFRKVAELEQLS